jgi:hypothetical protein
VHVEHEQQLSGNRNSYSRMSARVLPELTGPEEPDLVVIAHAIPDCDPSRSISGYLEQSLAGQPLIFAVTEQGRTTPFAALRLAQDLAQWGEYRRTAVVALDQGTVVYGDPGLAAMDIGTDHAVGLLFTDDGPIRVSVLRQLTGIAPDQAGAVLARELADLALTGDVTVLCGDPTVDIHSGPDIRQRRATDGQLCTAVWSELAHELAASAPMRRTVVAVEYEPALGYLCLAAFEVPAIHGVSR